MVVAVVLSLLFQQTALAAYVCVSVNVPPQTTAMSMPCHGMSMPQQQPSVLCAAYRTQQASAIHDVPAAPLPVHLVLAWIPLATSTTTVLQAPGYASYPHDTVWRPSGFPPELKVRVLLI